MGCFNYKLIVTHSNKFLDYLLLSAAHIIIIVREFNYIIWKIYTSKVIKILKFSLKVKTYRYGSKKENSIKI